MSTKHNRPQSPLFPPSFYKQRDWIDTLLPHENIGQRARPLFALEVRGMQRQPDDLKAAMVRQLKVVIGSTLTAFSILLLTMMASGDAGAQIYALLWTVIACLLVFSIVDKFVLDYVGLNAGASSYHDDRIHRELVLLTGLQNEEIIHARHAAAQVRVWGLMMFFICLRVAVVLLTILTIILPTLLVPQHVDPLFSLQSIQLGNPASTITTFLGFLWLFASLAVGGAVYILEPLWRLRALTAAGLLAASITLPETNRGLRYNTEMLLRLWGRELLIWGAAALVMFMTLGLMLLVLPLIFAAIGWATYQTHDRLTARWLYAAHQHATQDMA